MENLNSPGKDDEADHRATGQKSKRSEEGETDTPLKRLEKVSSDGGNSGHESHPSYDKDVSSALALLSSSSTNIASLNTLNEIATLLEPAKKLVDLKPYSYLKENANLKAEKNAVNYGCRVSFAELMKHIRNVSLDTSDEEFDEWFMELDHFSEFGFKVAPVKDHLTQVRNMLYDAKKSNDERNLMVRAAETEALELTERRSEMLKLAADVSVREIRVKDRQKDAQAAEEKFASDFKKFIDAAELPF